MSSNKYIQYQIYKLLLLFLVLMIAILNLNNVFSNPKFNLETESPLNIIIACDAIAIIAIISIYIILLFINFWGILNSKKISIIINIIIIIHCLFWSYWSISHLYNNNYLVYTKYAYKYIPTAVLSLTLVIGFLMQWPIISYSFRKKIKKTIVNKHVPNKKLNNIEYSSAVRRSLKFLNYRTSDFYKLYFSYNQAKRDKIKMKIGISTILLIFIFCLISYSFMSIYINKSPINNTENSLYTRYIIILSLAILISWFLLWINYYTVFTRIFISNRRSRFFLEFLNTLLVKINIEDYVNYSKDTIIIFGQKTIYKIDIMSIKRNTIIFCLLSENQNINEILKKEKFIKIKNNDILSIRTSNKNNILKLIIRILKEDVNND